MTERQQDLWLTPEGEAEIMQRQCLKRKLMPDDIARVVLFFAADDSGACTTSSMGAGLNHGRCRSWNGGL